jgi:hypothetical protein
MASGIKATGRKKVLGSVEINVSDLTMRKSKDEMVDGG